MRPYTYIVQYKSNNMSIDHKINNELEALFDFVPPKQLRQSVTQVFFGYLFNMKKELPENFERISEDIYFLLTFLEQVENHCTKS